MKYGKELLAVLGLTLGTPVAAAETTIDYQGVVVATPDPTQQYDLTIGSPVYFSVTFDPDKLVDVSHTFWNFDAITGNPVAIPGLRTASLSDDPDAAFSVTAGSHSFSKTDQPGYGTDFGLSAGNFPFAVFQGDTFVGVTFQGVADDGFLIDTDPIALALHYHPTDGVGGDLYNPNPAYGFLINIDLPRLQTAAPEPASWAMMVGGFGLVGAGLRRRSRALAFAD